MILQQLNKDILSAIHSARRIFLFGHKECPDGLGSTSALSSVLDSLKKEYVWWSRTPVPVGLRFIYHTENIRTDRDFHLDEFDTIISIDNSDLRQTGIEAELKEARANGRSLIINIDHHISNEFFGHINAVNIKASAAAELLYDFCRDNTLRISKDMAESLLCGIIGDTGNFSNNATNLRSLDIAAKLLSKGVSMAKIVNAIIEPRQKDIAILNLWGVVFSRLNFHETTGIATTIVLQKDLQEHNLPIEATEGIANFMNNLKDVKVSLVLTELPGRKIKGSLRTTRPDVDVAALAARLGGGGHKKAAGFTIEGSLNQNGKGTHIMKLFT
jgi:phosphoesterase RecJ-like protein